MGWAGGAAARPDDPGVKDVGPKVVSQGGKYYKIEIVPGKILRVPKSEIKRSANNMIFFRNPLTRLPCVAFFE